MLMLALNFGEANHQLGNPLHIMCTEAADRANDDSDIEGAIADPLVLGRRQFSLVRQSTEPPRQNVNIGQLLILGQAGPVLGGGSQRKERNSLTVDRTISAPNLASAIGELMASMNGSLGNMRPDDVSVEVDAHADATCSSTHSPLTEVAANASPLCGP
jgi:hypothetical protein